MYGAEQTKAYCYECKKLTLHKYKIFGQSNNKQNSKESFLKLLLSLFFSAPSGDYKCTKCGTYLNTPDNLD